MKNYLNCFTYVFLENGHVLGRTGIKCDELKDGMLLLNGMGKYRLLCEPILHDNDTDSEDDLIELFQGLYKGKQPWVAKEKDGIYLYSASFQENNRYFCAYDESQKHKDYVLVIAPDDRNLRILGGGNPMMFRYFANSRQYAMFELSYGAIIKYDGKNAFIMLEYLCDRQFLCR